MPTQRIVLGLVIAIGGTGIIASASAQEYRGTWEQQMACTPDVWRLCSDQVPDVGRIVACLRQNGPQLSNQCRAVFQSQADAQPAPRGPQYRDQYAPRAPPYGPPQAMRPRPMPPPPYYDDDE